jgi:hypothetical protein
MKLLSDHQGIEVKISVKAQLAALVEMYLTQHPHVSLNQLALRSEVPFTSLRRLIMEVKSAKTDGELAPHFVLNLSSYLYKDSCISSLIQLTSGGLQQYLKKHFGKFVANEVTARLATDRLDWSWLSLRQEFVLFCYLVSRPTGLAWNKVQAEWKNKFAEIFKLSIQNKWIKENSQKHYCWIGPEISELNLLLKQVDDLRLSFYSQHGQLEESTPLIEARVTWSTFEKLSTIMNQAALDCIKVVNEDRNNPTEDGARISVYQCSKLGILDLP